MKYQDFRKFMDKLFQMANEPLPSFSLLKDLFSTIDIRKDGIIDLNEWCQTFRQYQPPNASMQGRALMVQSPDPKTQAKSMHKSMYDQQFKNEEPLSHRQQS